MFLWMATALVSPSAAFAQAGSPTTVAELLAQGKRQLADKQYDDARQSCEQALAIDPNNVDVKLLLSDTDLQRWMRTRGGPDREKVYFEARNVLLSVLEREPDNKKALRRIAQLSFIGRDSAPGQDTAGWLSEARRWNLRLIEVDPNDSGAHFALGVLAWTKCAALDANLRSKAGMTATADGPISDEKIRTSFAEACRASVEEGTAQVKQALELKPGDAMYMRYLALMLRFRSDYAATPDAARPDIELAHQMESKADELNPRGDLLGHPAQ